MRILITKKNMPYIAASVGIPESQLIDKTLEAEIAFKKRQDMKFLLSFFNENEKWYQETKDKVAKIESTLPKGINHREKTIKMYGWIAKETNISGSLNLPFESDPEYSAAHAIELVFTGEIDLYHKILNWD